MVMVGRLLNGFGSARSINRRYIADTFPPRQRTAESANFVTAGALGMAAGPALASLLHIGSPDNDFREGFVHKHTEETIYEINQSPITVVTDDDHILFNNRNVWWTPENAPGMFINSIFVLEKEGTMLIAFVISCLLMTQDGSCWWFGPSFWFCYGFILKTLPNGKLHPRLLKTMWNRHKRVL